jgi:hypothetical protein
MAVSSGELFSGILGAIGGGSFGHFGEAYTIFPIVQFFAMAETQPGIGGPTPGAGSGPPSDNPS